MSFLEGEDVGLGVLMLGLMCAVGLGCWMGCLLDRAGPACCVHQIGRRPFSRFALALLMWFEEIRWRCIPHIRSKVLPGHAGQSHGTLVGGFETPANCIWEPRVLLEVMGSIAGKSWPVDLKEVLKKWQLEDVTWSLSREKRRGNAGGVEEVVGVRIHSVRSRVVLCEGPTVTVCGFNCKKNFSQLGVSFLQI
jgi:hypothetical protein